MMYKIDVPFVNGQFSIYGDVFNILFSHRINYDERMFYFLLLGIRIN